MGPGVPSNSNMGFVSTIFRGQTPALWGVTTLSGYAPHHVRVVLFFFDALNHFVLQITSRVMY